MPVQLMQDDDRIVVSDAQLIADGDPETTYTLRPLTREVRNRVLKTHTRKKPNPRTHQMEFDVDQVAISQDLIDYALIEWSGIVVRGVPVPCDREYKLQLDEVRLSALLEQAGYSKVVAAEEQRDRSFPGAA